MVRFRKLYVRVKDGVLDSTDREVVRIIDVIDSESHYLIEKFPKYHDEIDNVAKNVFSNRMTSPALKCSLGLNMQGTRDCSINECMLDSSCPRCVETED